MVQNPYLQTPVFQYLTRISDDQQRRDAVTLVQLLGAGTVGDLARYTQRQLVGSGVEEPLLGTLEATLASFDLHFAAQEPAALSPLPVPATGRQRQRAGRTPSSGGQRQRGRPVPGSGAPPPSALTYSGPRMHLSDYPSGGGA